MQITENENIEGKTIGSIVAKDIRKAEIFKKYGIDFCCGGKKTLKDICEQKGLDILTIEKELENITDIAHPTENFNELELDALADYIYNRHHLYYYNEEPFISELLNKVAIRHGEEHPELLTVQTLFKTLSEELGPHFKKEEKVLFPFIKTLSQIKRTNGNRALPDQFSIAQPLKVMESDHEIAGYLLKELEETTNNYSVPEGVCNSYRFLYKKLKDLDEDLRQHMHLENNILFTKALTLEKELAN